MRKYASCGRRLSGIGNHPSMSIHIICVVNFTNSLLCGVIYANGLRQVKVDMKSLFNATIQ